MEDLAARIVLVEGSAGDIRLTREALSDAKIHAELDLNLPRMDVTKPLDLDGLVEVLRSIDGLWLSIVRLTTR
jgi:hypothetical protein